jgi:hypothetical protein
MNGHNFRSPKIEQRRAWWQQVMKEKQMAGEADATKPNDAVDRMVAGIIGAIASSAATVDRCARCGTPEPDTEAPEYIYWESLPDCSPVCPDCVTPAEQQAADEVILTAPSRSIRPRHNRRGLPAGHRVRDTQSDSSRHPGTE